MSELPEGWETVVLADITNNHDGQRIPVRASDRQGRQGQYPYYGASGIIDSVNEYLFDGEYLLIAEDGANLLARSTPIAFQARGKFWVNNHAHVVTANEATSHSYIEYYLNSIDLAPFVTGSAQPKLTQKALNSIPVPLAPAHEQRRIVKKLDSLRARSARARHELDLIPNLIERYKQAILAKAFSGHLTTDWRVSRMLPVSPARSSAAFQLDDQERGRWACEELPAGWEWKRFSQFFSDETDSKRKLQQKAYETEGLYPVVDQGEAFIGGYTSDAGILCVTEPPIILFGDHTRCVKYIDFQFAQGADGTKVLKPHSEIEPRYAYYALRAIDLPNKGYSRHMKFVRSSLFPCCQFEEQQEVVARIDRAFSWLDKIATEHARADHLLPKLDQAILAKAFRGELVPQDPNDEPASVLLERIGAERETARNRGRRSRA